MNTSNFFRVSKKCFDFLLFTIDIEWVFEFFDASELIEQATKKSIKGSQNNKF